MIDGDLIRKTRSLAGPFSFQKTTIMELPVQLAGSFRQLKLFLMPSCVIFI